MDLKGLIPIVSKSEKKISSFNCRKHNDNVTVDSIQ
ncbi:hypothetical protein Bhyg_05219 [Pseudolycoriella hygida]|uniref:Uncharacterized protein n=1 Tax=Pseudolycoriella hygida TaxID=35572 RepID=A0A9Q0NGP6_9DIPT|nr:hypothetical protein Bhyg_05219 [Pseudolycoriella hygida]